MPKLRHFVIILSLIIGLILMIMPLPDWVQLYRPNWVALILIYWSMALPNQVGLWTAFITGLFVDVAQGTLLGQHALALVIIVYININFYQRVRVVPLPQQAAYVFVLLAIGQMIVAWVEGIVGRPVPILVFFSAPFIGMLIWPWVFVILRDIRRKFILN